jgi:adenosylcobinamide-GDP ribazoletransferase
VNEDHSEQRTATPADPVESVRMALRFFSRLPIGGMDRPDLNRIAPWVPVAGIAIGIFPALILAALVLMGVPSLFAAAVAVAAWVIATGAMAEDGLADAMDGLFGGASRERRLEILKDPRHGTYGVSALVLSFLMRVAALATLAFTHPVTGALAWLGIGIAARSLALWLPATMAAARSDGAAASAGSVSLPRFIAGAALAAILAVLATAPIAGLDGALLALVVMAAAILAWRAICHVLVGGHTGDLIGAGQLILEIAALGLFMLWVS